MKDMNNKRGDMKNRKNWKAIIMPLSTIIVFFVTYSLILPAITLEEKEAVDLPGIYMEKSGEGNSEEGKTAEMADDNHTDEADDEVYRENFTLPRRLGSDQSIAV